MRVSRSPHSHPKEASPKPHTEAHPSSTVLSPHSSHKRTTYLEDPFIHQPPPLSWRRKRPSYVRGARTSELPVDLPLRKARLRAYTSTPGVDKIYLPLPVRHLELVVEPKLAYTSTSTATCAMPRLRRIGLVTGLMQAGPQPSIEG